MDGCRAALATGTHVQQTLLNLALALRSQPHTCHKERMGLAYNANADLNFSNCRLPQTWIVLEISMLLTTGSHDVKSATADPRATLQLDRSRHGNDNGRCTSQGSEVFWEGERAIQKVTMSFTSATLHSAAVTAGSLGPCSSRKPSERMAAPSSLSSTASWKIDHERRWQAPGSFRSGHTLNQAADWA
jgi:hypothetical protein